MEIDSEKYDEVDVTDVDFIFGQGDLYSVTLSPGDEFIQPPSLGTPGQYVINFKHGEQQAINAMSVQCVSVRTRKMMVLKPEAAAAEKAAREELLKSAIAHSKAQYNKRIN